jgi:hypothetical protein
MATILMANPTNVLRSRTPAKLYVYETLLERLPQDLQDMAAALGQLIQEEHAMVRQRHLARHGHVPPTDQSRIRDGLVGARHGRVVTTAVRSPVRLAKRWIRVVSMASASVIAGRSVVSRRASIDVPAPGGPRRRRLWAERLHDLQFYLAISK